MQEPSDGVQRYEDDVGREGGPVAVYGGFDGAEVEGAVRVGAERDEVKVVRRRAGHLVCGDGLGLA